VTNRRLRRSDGMRWSVTACCVALAASGCGAGEEEATAPPADPDQPISSPADPAPPAGKPAPIKACRQLGRRIVGDRIDDATGRAERRGCPLRVAVLDGEGQILTDDFQQARINVRVHDGVVTDVEFMG
jgi:hypothetical protein